MSHDEGLALFTGSPCRYGVPLDFHLCKESPTGDCYFATTAFNMLSPWKGMR